VARLQNVPMSLGRTVASAVRVGDRIKVRLNDGSERTVDHVLLGTGYQIDVSKYDFLSPELAKAIGCFQGYPRLTEGLEASVPGLHFVGAPAMWSFGALMRFVVGTHYASGALMRYVARKAEVSRVQVGGPLSAEVGRRAAGSATRSQSPSLQP
jgi:hypothetical protein